MDWTVLGVGALTAAAAIGAQLVQVWAAARREEQDQRQRGWEARRDVLLELLARVAQLNAMAEGAAATGSGHRPDRDVERAFTIAATNAEFFASPDAWAEMSPLVRAVQLRYNATQASAMAGPRAEAAAALREIDAEDDSGWDGLWQRYLEAARRDLGLAPPGG